MRIVMPVGLVREIDAVILSGRGGYQTRAEFIVDAIQERLSELAGELIDAGRPTVSDHLPAQVPVERGPRSPTVPEGTRHDHGSLDQVPSAVSDEGLNTSHSSQHDNDSIFRLGPARRCETIEPNSETRSGNVLFGLHNRDFPSLWSLHVLAELCGDGLPDADDFYRTVLKRAWDYGAQLKRYEERTGNKSTALFPTNPEKRKAAESAFRSFAIGDYNASVGPRPTTHGPLFEWRAASITDQEGRLVIAPTRAGLDLLDAVADISVAEPHPLPSARAFLAHLAEHAPADFAGFKSVLQGIGNGGSSRSELLTNLAASWPAWSDNELSTNAAGYVARAREWGLVQAKQVGGRYYLTDFGLEMLTTNTEEAR